MGRSVLTLADSIQAFNSLEPDAEFYQSQWDDDPSLADDYADVEEFMWKSWDLGDSNYDFEWYLDDVRARVLEMFPSMVKEDSWIDRELHVIASNAHSIVTVSEYCGMIAVCLGANYDRDEYWRDPNPALGEHWRSQVEEKFLQAFSEYKKIGTFSNGEAVFEKA